MTRGLERAKGERGWARAGEVVQRFRKALPAAAAKLRRHTQPASYEEGGVSGRSIHRSATLQFSLYDTSSRVPPPS